MSERERESKRERMSERERERERTQYIERERERERKKNDPERERTKYIEREREIMCYVISLDVNVVGGLLGREGESESERGRG